MRSLVLVALVVVPLGLAGCTQGDGNDGTPFTGTCPAWTQGRSSHGYSNIGPFSHNATQVEKTKSDTFGGGLLYVDDRPLDIVSLSLYKDQAGKEHFIYVQDGTLRAVFTREDTGAPVMAYDTARGARGPANPGQSEWVFLPKAEPYTNITWQIDLADPDEPASPSAINVDWIWTPDRDEDPETPSNAFISYHVDFWYRSCE